MLTVWAGFYYFLLYKKYDEVLSHKERKVWLAVLFLYPILETLIKVFIEANFIPYSWRPINIAEHILWAASMYLILLPITKRFINRNGLFLGLFITFCIVILIGNINEFVEAALRFLWNLNTESRLIAYYFDTIIDLIDNCIGGLIGMHLTKHISSKNP